MPTVTTNTAANSALRFLNLNSQRSGSSISKLASGSRIVNASDDAAGLAIGTRLRADSNVLQQASINSAQGASVMQVGDGGLARVSDVLQRLKSLAAASLSGVPTVVERGFINAEYSQLLLEIDGIASSTRFNGESLLDGTGAQFGAGTVNFFVGVTPADVIPVNISSLSASAANFTSGGLATGGTTLGTTSVTTPAAATIAMASVDTAINEVSEARANIGSIVSRFEFRQQQVATSKENIDAALSSVMDVDLAAEQSRLVSSQVLVQASVSALSQANQLPQTLLSLLQ
ncbi:flagellin [Kiloniella spongiae]|uniref:Flagellin n=1 Tax=Kiloniella spongiae TaxID=1489064 RepID=A0A0H2MEE0_9PROT|nr:flagellin [Kiloniella spongiae]KLN59037.1 flagellin [Kiloniella spongiae]